MVKIVTNADIILIPFFIMMVIINVFNYYHLPHEVYPSSDMKTVQQYLRHSKEPVALYLFSSKCDICIKQMPEIQKINININYPFLAVDIAKDDITEIVSVNSYPLIIIFEDGMQIKDFSGQNMVGDYAKWSKNRI